MALGSNKTRPKVAKHQNGLCVIYHKNAIVISFELPRLIFLFISQVFKFTACQVNICADERVNQGTTKQEPNPKKKEKK